MEKDFHAGPDMDNTTHALTILDLMVAPGLGELEDCIQVSQQVLHQSSNHAMFAFLATPYLGQKYSVIMSMKNKYKKIKPKQQ